MRLAIAMVAGALLLGGCGHCDIAFCTSQKLCVCGLEDTPDNRARMERMVDVAFAQCGSGSLNGWSLEFQDVKNGVECDNVFVPFDGSRPAYGCTDYSRKDIKIQRYTNQGIGDCYEHTSAVHEICHALIGSPVLHHDFHGSREEKTLCSRWVEVGAGVPACDAQGLDRCYWEE